VRTPLRPSAWLSSRVAANVSLKLETLQPTGSYKVRGALNAVLRLVESGSDPGTLVTASAGNHGRALAHAAAGAGLPLTVYVPETAPRVKLEPLDRAGAQVIRCRDYDDAERRARIHGRSARCTFVSPYAHPDVIAGAGTIALEVLAEDPTVDFIVASVGGGGLISGVAVGAAGHADVWGVEVAASCPFTRSLAAGRIVSIDVLPTLADGLAGNLDPDTITFDLVRELVKGIVTVSEEDLRDAMRGLVAEEALAVEGAAAAAVAGVLSGRIAVKGRHVAIVISGANIDPDTLRSVLSERQPAPADG
jgi:threonine dehydratase